MIWIPVNWNPYYLISSIWMQLLTLCPVYLHFPPSIQMETCLKSKQFVMWSHLWNYFSCHLLWAVFLYAIHIISQLTIGFLLNKRINKLSLLNNLYSVKGYLIVPWHPFLVLVVSCVKVKLICVPIDKSYCFDLPD